MTKQQEKLLQMLEDHGKSIYGLLTRLTLREDIAEELMQDLFIKLNNLKTFEKIANLKAYAQKMAVNLAFDWRRKQKHSSLSLAEINEPPANQTSPLNPLIQAEQLQQVLGAVAKLKGSSRQVFVMHYIQQDSYDKIANRLKKPPHQVRAICSKALTKVRGLVSKSRGE